MEQVEECIKNRLEFKEKVYEEEDIFLLAIEELDLREKQLDISHEELKTVWILQKARKRKSIEVFLYQQLRDFVKVGGEDVVKNFGAKFRELKIEGSRKKSIKNLFMGTGSGARRNFQECNSR